MDVQAQPLCAASHPSWPTARAVPLAELQTPPRGARGNQRPLGPGEEQPGTSPPRRCPAWLTPRLCCALHGRLPTRALMQESRVQRTDPSGNHWLEELAGEKKIIKKRKEKGSSLGAGCICSKNCQVRTVLKKSQGTPETAFKLQCAAEVSWSQEICL